MMQQNDIWLTVLSGTLILLFLSFTIIFLIAVYRRKQQEYVANQLKMEENFKKELLNAQLEMQELTFQSLSQELHDNIGQVLSLAKLNITLIDSSKIPDIKDNIDQTKDLLNNAISDLRDISKTLNTNYIREKDLSDSINRELAMLERVRKFKTSFVENGPTIDLPAEVRLIIFRVIQECLNNAVKHAHASTLSIEINNAAPILEINVKDNGIGFEKNTEKGVGMYNMKNRMNMINGKMEINSIKNVGTHIRLSINTSHINQTG
jgi:signal transduction histidine kinase